MKYHNICPGCSNVSGVQVGSKYKLSMRVHGSVMNYTQEICRNFNRPHSAMEEICLSFLNSQQVKALSAGPSPDMQNTLFLSYCSVCLGVHARTELSDCVRSLAARAPKRGLWPGIDRETFKASTEDVFFVV